MQNAECRMIEGFCRSKNLLFYMPLCKIIHKTNVSERRGVGRFPFRAGARNEFSPQSIFVSFDASKESPPGRANNKTKYPLKLILSALMGIFIVNTITNKECALHIPCYFLYHTMHFAILPINYQ